MQQEHIDDLHTVAQKLCHWQAEWQHMHDSFVSGKWYDIALQLTLRASILALHLYLLPNAVQYSLDRLADQQLLLMSTAV